MPAEHIRPFGKHGKGLSQGYYCKNCGEVCNMLATGHTDPKDFFGWLCESNSELVKILDDLNKT